MPVELNPFLHERVESGRLGETTVPANIRPAEVVGHDEENIGFFGSSSG
jgi:hypothetical protein